MKTETGAIVRRADYAPYPFEVRETRLAFDLRDRETVVRNRLELRRLGAGNDPLVLDGEGLDLRSVAVDGVELTSNEYAVDERTLTVHDVPDACTVEIEVAIVPEKNESGNGLYRSGALYCTQCEPEGFRHITYFPDRPDVLSVYTVTIEADAGEFPVLLSNGNLVEITEPDEEGRHSATWHDPFRKPTYLFALVAGSLAVLEDEFVTASGRTVALRIFSEHHNIDKCGVPMAALKRAMRWDEERFGREYDLDVFMIVAVESFNFGAMENKGLNIFNVAALLASPDTADDDRLLRVESIVAHEYFHNFSGNRVTCRDWFQLSLKEGFTVYRDQEFSADMHSRTVKRIDDVNLLRAAQFAEDAGPLAHPVRPDSYEAIENFYTRTVYEKGAEVVRMIATLLGPGAFRAGSDLYFSRHDGDAVTIEDFVRAMEAASGIDLAQFRRWYEQAGTPVLEVVERRHGETVELTITQSCPPTPGQPEKQPFPIPFALGAVRDGLDLLGAAGRVNGFTASATGDAPIDNPAGDGTLVIGLQETTTTLTLHNVPADADLSLLRGFSAPVILSARREPAALRRIARSDTDGFGRWDAAQALYVEAILNDSAADEALAMAGDLRAAALEAPDDGEARALYAASLTLPGPSWLLQLAPGADILLIVHRREALADRIADAYDWQAVVDANRTPIYEPSFRDIGRRRLRHRALAYAVRGLDRTDPQGAAGILRSMLDDADNFTDRRAALRELVRLGSLPAEDKALILDGFYRQWAHESLVVDAWFAVQAMAPLPDGLARAQALTRHEAFDPKNPNKLLSVIRSFAAGNPLNFHARGGDAYRWLGERALEVDGFNPQIGALLARELTAWTLHDSRRGREMRSVLTWLDGHDLSSQLRELVTKGLAPAAG